MRASLAACILLAGCGTVAPRPATAPHAPAMADGIPLGPLARQALAKGECALFLWKGEPGARLVLMAKSGPSPFARILLDGRTLDLPRLDAPPTDVDATAAARYGDGRVTAALDLTIERREGLSDGAIARGTVAIQRSGGEGFVVPVSGLLACA